MLQRGGDIRFYGVASRFIRFNFRVVNNYFVTFVYLNWRLRCMFFISDFSSALLSVQCTVYECYGNSVCRSVRPSVRNYIRVSNISIIQPRHFIFSVEYRAQIRSDVTTLVWDVR